jgi:hypothetical protein
MSSMIGPIELLTLKTNNRLLKPNTMSPTIKSEPPWRNCPSSLKRLWITKMSTFLMFTASSTAYASWHAHHPTFLNQPHPEECHHANVNIGSAHNAVQSSSSQNNQDIDAQEQLALSTVKRNSSELITETGATVKFRSSVIWQKPCPSLS